MAKAVSKIRAVLKTHVGEITASQISEKTKLAPAEISMALCYLLKSGYVTRSLMPSNCAHGRRNIWVYTYHPEKLLIITH